MLKLRQSHLNFGLNVTIDIFPASVQFADKIPEKIQIFEMMCLIKKELPPIEMFCHNIHLLH